MKKIIVFIILVMASLNGFAYEKGPGFYVEYGQSLLPVGTFTYDPEFKEYTDYSKYISYTDVNLHYTFQFWDIQLIPFTNIKTWLVSNKNFLHGTPFCNIYTLGAEIKWGSISLIVDHYCAHPVYGNDTSWQVKDYRMGQNMDEIKIKYSFN